MWRLAGARSRATAPSTNRVVPRRHTKLPTALGRGDGAPATTTLAASTADPSSSSSSSADGVLEAFWYSRGVFDADSRAQLVHLSKQLLLDQRRQREQDDWPSARFGRAGPADDALSLLGPAPFTAGPAVEEEEEQQPSVSRPSSSSDLFGGGAAVWDDFYASAPPPSVASGGPRGGGGGGGGGGGVFSSPTPLSPTVAALPDSGLPGISAVWSLADGLDGDGAIQAATADGTTAAAAAPLREAARRLLALHALLGGGEGADVVHMVAREPGLLAADPAVLAARLLRLRVAVARLSERLRRAEEEEEDDRPAARSRAFAAPWEQPAEEQPQSNTTATDQKASILPPPPEIAAPAGVVPEPGRAAREAVAARASAARAWGRRQQLRGGALLPDAIKLVVRQPALMLSPLLDESVDDEEEEDADDDAPWASDADEDDGDRALLAQLPPALAAARREQQQRQQKKSQAPLGVPPQTTTSTSRRQTRQTRQTRQALLLAAWEFGLARDADAEWSLRFKQLEAYRGRHGDCAAGLREGDDPDLGRWCSLQRALFARGGLAEERKQALGRAGFVFDGDEAEWRRWFLALARFRERHGHSSPGGLTLAAMGGAASSSSGGAEVEEEGGGSGGGDGGGETLYLANWCSVQRVARRCRVLSAEREAMLLSLGFDFDGADPLS
jgi:hypothetical protein